MARLVGAVDRRRAEVAARGRACVRDEPRRPRRAEGPPHAGRGARRAHRDQPHRQSRHGHRRHRRRAHRRHRRVAGAAARSRKRRPASASTCTARPATSPPRRSARPALVAGDVLRYLGAAWRAVAGEDADDAARLTDVDPVSRSDAETEAVGAALGIAARGRRARPPLRRARRGKDGVRARAGGGPGHRPGRGQQPDVHARAGIPRAACRCTTSISIAWRPAR